MEHAQLTSAIVEYEMGVLSANATVELFAELIRTGMAWQLQGHFGRTAMDFIQRGVIGRDGSILKRAA